MSAYECVTPSAIYGGMRYNGGTNQTARSGVASTNPEPDGLSAVTGKAAATMIADPSTPRDQSHTFSIPKQGSQRFQESMLVRVGMMLGVYKMMSEEQRAELLQWERDNLRLGLATSDWPGWERWIAPLPDDSDPAAYIKKPIPKPLRTVVFERDGYRCVACGDWHDLTCDHIIPESKGGPTTLDNLQTMCRSCNSRKGTR